jgi:hypothetical protein
MFYFRISMFIGIVAAASAACDPDGAGVLGGQTWKPGVINMALKKHDDAAPVAVGSGVVVGEALATLMKGPQSDGLPVMVDVGCALPADSPEEAEVGVAGTTVGLQDIKVNSRSMTTPEQFRGHEASREALRLSSMGRRLLHRKACAKAAMKVANVPWTGDAASKASETEGPLVLSLTIEKIQRLMTEGQGFLASLELHSEGTDESLATAKQATSTINLPTNTYGLGVGIYMTESGCRNANTLTNYLRLSGSQTDHSVNVSSIIRSVSTLSWLYCRSGGVLPTAGDMASGPGGNPGIRIVNRSNFEADTNVYDSYTSQWDDWIFNNRVLVVKSAGNFGAAPDSTNVTTPGGGLNVLTVGNYNDSNNTIAAQSSWRDPTSKNAKPELSAPGINIDAGGFTMSGTSQATPFVTAIAADLMQTYPWLQGRAHVLKAALMSGATDAVTGAVDKVGLGGIDLGSVHGDLGGWWWEGGNSAFSTWDSSDFQGSNGTIDAQFSATAGWTRVRVVLVWLNRGSWTLSHINDSHPIGIDMDLTVKDPNGNFVGSSSSFDNGFEVVDFAPTMSGNYSFHINRFENRDTSSSILMGVAVNRDL